MFARDEFLVLDAIPFLSVVARPRRDRQKPNMSHYLKCRSRNREIQSFDLTLRISLFKLSGKLN